MFIGKMSAANVQFFFMMRSQIKLYHWQTKMYSRHKATDGVIEALDASIDKYVEVYMGKYGRMKMNNSTATTTVKNLSESSIFNFIKRCIQYLNNDLVKNLKETDTDLVNIRDEMLAELNQLLYLFSLK
jgi:DNA-binding ferritin-like protein